MSEESDNNTPEPTVDELQKAHEKIRNLQGLLTTKEKEFSKFTSIYKDIDPEEHRTLKAKLEEKEREAAEKDPQKMEELFQRKLDKYRNEVETEKQSLQEQLEALSKVNKTLAVTDKVMSEIGGLFNQDAIKWIKREVEESCDLDEDGSIVVKDDSGDVIYKGTRPMTPKEFGELLAEKYPSLAKASGVSGVKDVTPGVRAAPKGTNKIPESWSELQAMPNAKEVLERLRKENPAAVQKILRTMSA
jgi:vacuolar-type H+-ATPase subunit I/STV1